MLSGSTDLYGFSTRIASTIWSTLTIGICCPFPIYWIAFKYDVEKWILDSTNQNMDKFEFSTLRKIMFTYTPDEIELFRNNMDIYGISTNGMAQVLKRISNVYLWRKPITIS